jgi:DNA helicase II / ATP-dependent DNA helicase PcrA
VPGLPETLSHRFPFVLVDEMQDTSEEQNAFLTRLFPRDSNAVCVQRIGDPNQAIFEGGSAPRQDPFPDQHADRCLSIPNSFRFGPSIASLASPFAFHPVHPSGLRGIGPTAGEYVDQLHTIFLFPDDDVVGVLNAFGRHVLGSFPIEWIDKSIVSAIGAVHRPSDDVGPGHDQYPKTVSHYWAGYQSHVVKSARHWTTLAEYFLRAQLLAASGGPFGQAVNSMAFGIIRLGKLLTEKSIALGRTRPHRLVEEQLSQNSELRTFYRELLTCFLADGESLTRDTWVGLRPRLRVLAAALVGGNPAAATANTFLEWPMQPEIPNAGVADDAHGIEPNSYRVRDGDRFVDIQLGSIHSVKGQTHLATLIVETFLYGHCLEATLEWLTGARSNGGQCAVRERERLLSTYVAMTRPTHLLCLAMRTSSVGTGEALTSNLEKLAERGWQVQRLTPIVIA